MKAHALGGLIAVTTLLGACAHSQPVPAAAAREESLVYFEPGSSGYTGDSRKASLLARGYVRPHEQLASFSYYVYLIFLDRAPGSQPYRKAAALAFIGLFDDVAHISLSPKSSDDLAVILAPVKSIQAAPATWEELISPQTYDYSSAELIGTELHRAGHAVPRVALVAATSPLAPDEPIANTNAVRIVAVCGAENEVAAQFLRLRETLKEGRADVAGPSVSDWIRTLFRSMGDMAAGGRDASESSALPNLECPPL